MRTASLWIVWRHKIALMDPLRAPARQPFEGAAETATAVWTSLAAVPSSKSPEFTVLSSDVARMLRSKAAGKPCGEDSSAPLHEAAGGRRHDMAPPGEFAPWPFRREIICQTNGGRLANAGSLTTRQ